MSNRSEVSNGIVPGAVLEAVARQTRTLLVSIAAMLALTGCGDTDTAEPVKPDRVPKPVEIEILAPQNLVSYTRGPGMVEAHSRMSLSFRVGGTVSQIAVEEGDHVERGAIIAELDRRDYTRDVALARASLTSAEARAADALREFERVKQLRSANSISAQRLDGARSSHEVAQAEARQASLQLEAAEIAVEDCSLRAPVSGYVEKRLLEKHEVAAPDTTVVVLTELGTLKVRASVADRAFSKLAPGMSASVRSNAWPGRVFEGRVARVGMAADAATHTLPIEIEIDNKDLALRPAMVVEVSIPVGDETDLLSVPMNAVVRDSSLQALCFVVLSNADETLAESRPVSLGRLIGDRVVITSGLRAGDRVIVHGQHFLRTGDGVRIAKSSSANPVTGIGGRP